jgi:hypothetical protein
MVVDQHTTMASPDEGAGQRRAPALQVDGVSKRFAAVHALTDVGVTFEAVSRPSSARTAPASRR